MYGITAPSLYVGGAAGGQPPERAGGARGLGIWITRKRLLELPPLSMDFWRLAQLRTASHGSSDSGAAAPAGGLLR
ncbi:hypothetical protein CHLRE_16g685052v5 [Chlamydomonas reinhardtii]|uniref:Uncharacterized protein n=1 Tax=Chlamydomonas reinhardtii TaxID=3055 RepID=A0A2K3CUT0_CHLRE|nr:uncharacterized protein CHLRE_16g685052v5 [Chlamydomonas reinhardtii]PNW72037.1 hypothetical protein CHLRE_16g685052v5 [Chlamydomonas reinhardtii]